MTKAEQLRKITERAKEERHIQNIAMHNKYAEKIINRKCHWNAICGRTSATVKVRKKYAPSLVVEHLVDKGFEVIENSKNGRAILTIKW